VHYAGSAKAYTIFADMVQSHKIIMYFFPWVGVVMLRCLGVVNGMTRDPKVLQFSLHSSHLIDEPGITKLPTLHKYYIRKGVMHIGGKN
jgi:hypothetical protein